MANRVVHFEVTGSDGKKLQDFYSALFGWDVDASNPMQYGLVSDAQLAWLSELLAEPAPAGSVVVVHHPPIGLASVPWMTADGLRNAESLGDVLAGTDVRAVLCGHFHVQLAGSLRGIPVSVTPGVVTRLDLTTRPHLWRGVKGAGATVVDLDAAGGPLFHALQARDPHAGELVYLIDGRTGADVTSED